MDDFYAGEGTDTTGVPTKMVTVNCSVKISVYNTATMFGIHVTSGPIRLKFSEITIATGEVSFSLNVVFDHMQRSIIYPSNCIMKNLNWDSTESLSHDERNHFGC